MAEGKKQKEENRKLNENELNKQFISLRVRDDDR